MRKVWRVPVSVSKAINARRKEKMRWVGEREDTLEIVEDGLFEGTDQEGYDKPDVCSRRMEEQ